MDTTILAPRQPIAPAHVHAEWAELRPTLNMVVLTAKHLLSNLRDIPRPLYADERRKADKAREAFAEQIKFGLIDLLGDLMGPLYERADDAGIDPNIVAIDLHDLQEEYAALSREASQTCVTSKREVV